MGDVKVVHLNGKETERHETSALPSLAGMVEHTKETFLETTLIAVAYSDA